MLLLCFVLAEISDWKLHAAVLYLRSPCLSIPPNTRGDLQEDEVSCDKEVADFISGF